MSKTQYFNESRKIVYSIMFVSNTSTVSNNGNDNIIE